jgi:ribose 5-phosphate isomerase B
MADDATRDRVRALVRDVLNKTMPEAAPSANADHAHHPTQASSSQGPAVTRDESAKLVITEDDVRGLERGAVLRVAENARLTPLAADIVKDRGIELTRRVSRSGLKQVKTVAVGADHGGYLMKEELKKFLTELGHRVHDFGTNSDSVVDYPDFAHAVARAVSDGSAEVGIVIDGAGVGSAMTANKVPGVRAAACY